MPGESVIGNQRADEEFTQITTTRLIIRRFHKTDASSFSALRNYETVARYQDWPFPFTEKNSSAFMEQMTCSHPDIAGEWFQFALEECKTGTLIGDIGIHPDSHGRGEVEIGFSLHPDYQGKGFMSEALATVIDYLFSKRGKRRILAVVDTRNAPSQRLMERLGFVRERILADPDRDDAAVNEYGFVLTSSRWVAQR